MEYLYFLSLLFPVVFAVLHRRTKKYPFSPMVTLSCALIAGLCGYPVLCGGLVISAAADWFLHHERGRQAYFLCGVAGFFVGHVCFAVHSVISGGFSWISAAVFTGLLVLIAVFLLRRIWRGIGNGALRFAVTAYAAVSCLSFGAALSSGFGLAARLIFSLGIFAILFSDCLIALSRFGRVKKIGKWIMPTYFACHILIAAACLWEKSNKFF